MRSPAAGKTHGRAEGEVAAQTHARGTDEAGAGGHAEEVVDCLVGVFVVGLQGLRRRGSASQTSEVTWEEEETAHLFGLELVPALRVGGVVAQRLRADKVVVRRWRGHNVPVAGNLPGEPGDGAGDWGPMVSEGARAG